MSIKLDQHIHRIIVDHCGGKTQNVKGIAQGTLSKMAKGKSNVTVRTIREALKANGMTGEIIVYGNGTKTTINLFE